MDQFGEEHYRTKEQLGTVDRERSENANGLMSSLVIFPAAQEEKEWSYLKVG